MKEAIKFDGKNIEKVFNLPCVTSMRKAFPNVTYVTVLCFDGIKRLVRKGDWIVHHRKGKNFGWDVLTNEEYKKQQRP